MAKFDAQENILIFLKLQWLTFLKVDHLKLPAKMVYPTNRADLDQPASKEVLSGFYWGTERAQLRTAGLDKSVVFVFKVPPTA